MKQAGSTTYLVNGLGQRVKKSGGTDTYFAYDEAGTLIGEYDATGAPIQETLWLGDLPIAVIKPASPSGFTAFYVWADHLGTPRQITDTSNVSRWDWAHNDPFGNNTPNENPAGAGNFVYNLRFPGQYFDAETGKHYNYFRDYDPSIGRYIQSDPIGLSGGIDTYRYAFDSPLIYYDVEGTVAAQTVVFCAAAALITYSAYKLFGKYSCQRDCQVDCSIKHSCKDGSCPLAEGNTGPLNACRRECVGGCWLGMGKKGPMGPTPTSPPNNPSPLPKK